MLKVSLSSTSSAAGHLIVQDVEMEDVTLAQDERDNSNEKEKTQRTEGPPYYHSPAERKAIARKIRARTAELGAIFNATYERVQKRKALE